jgi:hypothetical protein
MDDLGAGFWLKALGVIIAFGIGGIILFWIIGMAWYAWGAFGALLFCFALIALAGWIYDRTHRSTYDDLNA